MSAIGPARPRPELPAEAYRDMAIVLRAGLAFALSILFGALVAFYLQNPAASSEAVTATNPILSYLSLSGLIHGLGAGNPEAYLTLGILALLATPIARVLAGFYFFRRNGEIEISRVALTVAILLVLGLVVVGPILR